MSSRNPFLRFAPILVACLALAMIGVSLWHLESMRRALDIHETHAGSVPLTVFSPRNAANGPTVIIAHGFAGSQQLMQAYAMALARHGYRTVTFDFPGHGANPHTFVRRIEDEDERVALLLGALEDVIGHLARLPGGDGRLALLGHSMAGDVLLRYAARHRDAVSATVLVSPYIGPSAPSTEVRDLLLVFGALEPDALHRVGRDAITRSTGEAVESGVVYGNAKDGTARSLVIVPGAEHIGVLYAADALRAAQDWLDRSLGTPPGSAGAREPERRGLWLAVLFLGIVALVWPLTRLLPRAATAPLGAGLPWRRLWPVAVAPALLTPLVLRFTPRPQLPLLLGDYLAMHFALYGVLTLLGITLTARARTSSAARPIWLGLIVGAIASSAYLTLVTAWPLDRFVLSFFPNAERARLLGLILPATVIYFAADGWLVRGQGAARAGGLATKSLFIFSLLLAVALDLRALFFLVIIVPAILVFFVVYGLVGRWIYQRTGHPLVGAIASGTACAWAITATFPLVGP